MLKRIFKNDRLLPVAQKRLSPLRGSCYNALSIARRWVCRK